MLEKSLGVLVSPCHCLICILLQRRGKRGLREIWVNQALLYSLSPPSTHVRPSSPRQDGGSGGQEGALDRIGASGVCRGESSSLGVVGVGLRPSSCQCARSCPVSGCSAIAFLFPPQSLRLSSLHYLCQTPVSGFGGLLGLCRGRSSPLWW